MEKKHHDEFAILKLCSKFLVQYPAENHEKIRNIMGGIKKYPYNERNDPSYDLFSAM